MIFYPANLTTIMENVGETFLHQQPINKIQSQEINSLLVSRQVNFGKNSAFFLPFASEKDRPPRLFTGETLRTDFAFRHIQLIEATRLLILLGEEREVVQHSISLAKQRMAASCYSTFCAKGECKAITIAYMRYMNCLAHQDIEPRLLHFLASLSSFRDGRGRWRGFPYYYTLLMLTELDESLAAQEINYAAPACEKLLKRARGSDQFSQRRQLILRNVLSRN